MFIKVQVSRCSFYRSRGEISETFDLGSGGTSKLVLKLKTEHRKFCWISFTYFTFVFCKWLPFFPPTKSNFEMFLSAFRYCQCPANAPLYIHASVYLNSLLSPLGRLLKRLSLRPLVSTWAIIRLSQWKSFFVKFFTLRLYTVFFSPFDPLLFFQLKWW